MTVSTKLAVACTMAIAAMTATAGDGYFETGIGCWIGANNTCAADEISARAQIAPVQVPGLVIPAYYEGALGCWIGAAGNCAADETSARAQFAPTIKTRLARPA